MSIKITTKKKTYKRVLCGKRVRVEHARPDGKCGPNKKKRIKSDKQKHKYSMKDR